MAKLKKEPIESKKVRNPYGYNALAVKAGPYLFLSGLMGFHPERPSVVTAYTDLPDEKIPYAFHQMGTDSWEGPGVVQTWRIFQQLKTIMEEQGSHIDETLWLWFSWLHMRDIVAQTRVRKEFFAGGLAPPETAFEVSGFPMREALHQIAGVGVVPVDGKWPVRREVLRSRHFDQLVVANYLMAARAGDLAFFAGIIGIDTKRRIVLQSFDEAEVKSPIHFGSPVAQRLLEPVAVQTWAIYDHYQKILAEYGCTLEHIVKQVIYLRDMNHIPIVDEVARHFFGDSVPPTTIHQVRTLAIPAYLIEIEAVVLMPRDPSTSGRPVFIPSAGGVEPWGRHALASRAGDFLFLSGLMADLPRTSRMVRGYEDLDGEGRKMATGSLVSDHQEGALAAQAWTVYEKAQRILEAQGSSLNDVVMTRVLLRDIEGLPTVERVARKFFPESPPATMILEVPDLPLPGSLIQLDVTALA